MNPAIPVILTEPDAIQEAIDRAYASLMRSTTDPERRHWCDRLHFWIARAAG